MAARESFFGSTASCASSQRQVVRGTERPAVTDMHEINAARGIFDLQTLEVRLDVDPRWQVPGQCFFINRLGGCEQQRFKQPKFLRSAFSRHFRLSGVTFANLDPQLGNTCHQQNLPPPRRGACRVHLIIHHDASGIWATAARLRT